MTVILSINESSKLDTFKKLLDTICQFTESFNLHISNENVFISTLDSTHISIINCSLDQSFVYVGSCSRPVSPWFPIFFKMSLFLSPT